MSGRTTHQGVVVGVDGSPSSTVAVRWAAREATMRNVPLTLVHAHAADARRVAPWLGPPAPFLRSLANGRKTEARKIIADAIKVVEDDADGGEHPEITSELSAAAPIPRSSTCPRRLRWSWLGAGGRVPCVASCSARSAPGWSTTRTARSR